MNRYAMALLYGASLLLHASLGAGVSTIEPTREPDRIAVKMVDVKKPEKKAAEEPPPPPPPPPPPKVEAPKAARKEAPKAEAPAPAAAAAVPSFGVALSGGVGAGGIAVPVGDVHAAKAEAPKRVQEEKTLTREPPKAHVEDACAEPLVKPKPLDLSRPEYTEEARAAGIEGKVRVELTVDAHGVVKSVRVLESLGHGLDEAATRSVQAATFEPARSCGVAVEATFVVSIRFTL